MSDQVPVVWTNDDICFGKCEQLERQLAFIEQFDIRGVFFVIPRAGGRDLDEDVALCGAMELARDRGHEFYQHGYVHTPFESGVPETWMLDFAPEVRARYDSDRLAIEQTHTLEKMIEKIEAGQRIWRRAFGDASVGYRPGWGAFCGSLYRALDVLGYQWVSSRISAVTSWLWNQGLWDQRVDFRETVPGKPWRIGRLVEYPITGDYGFMVPDDAEKIGRMADLCLDEFEQCRQRGWPFVIVSHHHGLERNDDSGYAVHRNAMPRLSTTGQASFMGMARLHAITSAALGASSDGDCNAGVLCL